MGSYMIYIALTGVLSLIGMVFSRRLKSKFEKYSQVPVANGMSGKEVAEAMLDHYGINDVKVVSQRGFLTDHYNPATKTVNLSEAVYDQRSIAAAAVAAHECGHAIQHAHGYKALKMRSAIVPVVQFSSKAQQILLMLSLGYLGTGLSTNPAILLVTCAAFFVTMLFSLVTLPVEFDASNRALAWLGDTKILQGAQYDGAKDALGAAAMTYVAAALSALAMFLFIALRFLAATRD